MDKCKRNIFLICAYLLLMAIVFLPCKNVYYHYVSGMDISSIEFYKSTDYERMRKPGKKIFVFFPFVFNPCAKYHKYKQWESDNFLALYSANMDKTSAMDMHNIYMDSYDRIPDNLSVEDHERRLEEIGRNLDEELEKKDAAAEIEGTRAGEFHQNFGDKPFYHTIMVERLITEIALIIFIGGFAFIVLCIVLKNKRENINKREGSENARNETQR